MSDERLTDEALARIAADLEAARRSWKIVHTWQYVDAVEALLAEVARLRAERDALRWTPNRREQHLPGTEED